MDNVSKTQMQWMLPVSQILSPSSSRHNLLGQEAVTGKVITETIEIPVLSLDDCLKDLRKVDFLKMDCEGSEAEILLKATEATLLKIHHLAVEIHDFVESNEIQQLRERMKQVFPIVRIVPQAKIKLGYLYAHR